MDVYNLKITSFKWLTEEVFAINLDLAGSFMPLPGQFVHVKCGTGLEKYLRRPISVCDVRNGEMVLVVEVKGAGTKEMSRLAPGQTLNIMGPLGNGFTTEGLEGKKIILAGGGLGCAPLFYLHRVALEKGACSTVFMGFRDKAHVILEEEFKALGGDVRVCTDDGSYGEPGYAVSYIGKLLQNGAKGEFDGIYTCGPRVMMDKVLNVAKAYNVPFEISLEERMGCGIGACLVCACKTDFLPGDEEDTYKHVCKDGPVFGTISFK